MARNDSNTIFGLEQVNDDDDDEGSDFSLDYEYVGPRQPVYRDDDDNDSLASVLSIASSRSDTAGFDMWDEDHYCSNDFTWQSNDMRLTHFIHQQHASLTPWPSFWRSDPGWPRQLPNSSTTTNHHQTSHALLLVPSSSLDQKECVYGIYRDSIVECGLPVDSIFLSPEAPLLPPSPVLANPVPPTVLHHCKRVQSDKPPFTTSKFCATHCSVPCASPALPKTSLSPATTPSSRYCIDQCRPFTKYLQRMSPRVQQPYLPLLFEPMCFEQRYGYLAIGGIEGEFELYCCMDPSSTPHKLWATKFNGNGNLMLMTNALQIVRYAADNDCDLITDCYLFSCMNEAGILVYRLPSHDQCKRHPSPAGASSSTAVPPPPPYAHLRSFSQLPINDARVSPDGSKLVCVGDDHDLYVISLSYQPSSLLSIGPAVKLTVPVQPSTCYSSQHVAWSPSSLYFAHTSDTHDRVLVWHASTLHLLYSIHASGYTYAVIFHPFLDSILVFANRYGYFHTVDLAQTTPDSLPSSSAPLQGSPMAPRHEITMVSFRGEKDRRLRILAKINGLQWSMDGVYLYVATKKRVLAYQFLQTDRFRPRKNAVTSLFDLARTQLNQLVQAHSLRPKRHCDLLDHHPAKRRCHRSPPDPSNCLTPIPSHLIHPHDNPWSLRLSMLPLSIRRQICAQVNEQNHWNL
ncbi:hypothetical protein DM01DRAFT_1337448 [Hesseltinella vesiculosa]|uniref:WD40 repeat-like protein n=1 Tax=Hesseltinella vesiculosa TaxID=101127 RepID=A0A1X2GCP0_9FUNG|nr:hypothetical protein DM01DRAFT_1337448 [Hesseltinella vesiculosa]